MKDELDLLRRALNDRAVELVNYALGEPPNRRLYKSHEIRWGRKGSFVVYVGGRSQCRWQDYEADEGGDLLQLIRSRICPGAAFPEIVSWARQWLGWPTDHATRQEPTNQIQLNAGLHEPTKQTALVDEEQLRKLRRAQDIWHRGLTVPDTPAQIYLTVTRRIPITIWPDCLRYDPVQKTLILKATTDTGEFAGIQRVYLTPDGTNVKDPESGRNKKLSLGPIGGAAVRLPGPTGGPLLLAEGPETGLSVWCATGYETWVALGSMRKLSPPLGRHVVICRDDDQRNPRGGSDRAIRNAKRHWRGQGIEVSEAWPWSRRRGDKSDFNDVMKALRPEGVRARIDRVMRQVIIRPNYYTLEDARGEAAQCVDAFFASAERWHSQRKRAEFDEDNILLKASLLSAVPPVHAFRLTVGGGKTEAALQAILRTLQELRARGVTQVIVLAAPQHLLSDEIARRFAEMASGTGLRAEVWRGREALVSGGSSRKMCQNIELAREGAALWADMEKEVCPECPYYNDCAYLLQRELDADFWIVAHQMLFHQTPGPIKKRGVYALIVDESVWKDGLFGTDQSAKIEISLNELEPGRLPVPPGKGPDSGERLADLRDRLRGACLAQSDGPLSRDTLIRAGFETDSARTAASLELRRKIKCGHWQTREHNRSLTRMVRLWEALDHLMTSNGSSLSGRISLVMAKTPEGIGYRALRIVGRHEIKDDWRTPTLLIDANFDKDLTNIYWPEIEKVTHIEVGMPQVQIFQAADRAFSKAMFLSKGKTDPRKARNLRAFILDVDRRLGGAMLVISNKEIVETLQLPEHVQRANFNALAGRDKWRKVRTIIIVGRPLPSPEAVEHIAGALTGKAPKSIGIDWYPKQDALRPIWDQIDPSLVCLTYCQANAHPDPIAEMIRHQIAEGEIIQAIGRGRGVQRTAQDPLTVFVLSDINLPIPISATFESQLATNPSPEARMLAEGGIAFDDAAGASKAYPQLWATADAARKAFQRERSAIRRRAKGSALPRRLLTPSWSRTQGGRWNGWWDLW